MSLPRQHPWHERQRRRQRGRDPDALERPGEDEGERRPARLDAREQEDAAREDVGDAPGEQEPEAAEGVDEPAADDRRRHLDEGGDPHDQADLRVRHVGLGEGEGQRGGIAVEAGLDEEQRGRKADDVHVGSGCSGADRGAGAGRRRRGAGEVSS